MCYAGLLSVKTYQRTGIWKDSLTLWNDAIKKFPENNDRGYLNRGSVLYSLGNYPMALQDYKKILAIDPYNGGAYVGMGLVKRSMKDMQGAMQDFNSALSYGQLYEGYLNRAVLKIDMKDFQGALDDLEKASQINSSNAELYVNKGFILFQTGKNSEALECYNRALELDPQESKAYRGRGQVKQAMNDLHGAMEDFNIALSLYQSYDYYLNRALLKYILKDNEGALYDLDNASGLNAYGYEAYFDKGFINLQTGNNRNAINEFDKAIKLNTSDFEAYLKRAIAKYNLANYEDAIMDLNQSIHLQPSSDALYYRGLIHIKLGKKTDGCKDLKQSTTMGNNDARLACQNCD
jgi:tetratricopeptide (TPR) repeat protein